MSVLKYVTIDRVFSKISRDLKGTELNDSDIIEWIGEALEFLEVPQILVEEVLFLKVKDYHVDLPSNLHMITQIAKRTNRNFTDVCKPCVPEETTEETTCETEETSCCPTEEAEVTPFSPICGTPSYLDNMPDTYVEAFLNAEEAQDICGEDLNTLDLDWTYNIWTSSEYYKRNFVPVRLATGTFFNSIVCKEKDPSLYLTCDYEYTIVGQTEKRLRFNFMDGEIAISFLKNSVDKETGYPLIPDNISYITAIVYFIKWKIAEMYDWAGREGWRSKAEAAEAKWLKYVKQAKNYMKMPKTLDQYQNLLEQTHYLIPNHNRYYSYFGNLGKRKTRHFNNLNRTRNNRYYQ